MGKSPTYTGMYYHKVSSDMQIGAELNHTSGKEVGLAFGCQYKLDKDTTVKAKVQKHFLFALAFVFWHSSQRLFSTTLELNDTCGWRASG